MANQKIVKISTNVREGSNGTTVGITFHREDENGESAVIRPDGTRNILNATYNLYSFEASPFKRARRLDLAHTMQKSLFYRLENKAMKEKS